LRLRSIKAGVRVNDEARNGRQEMNNKPIRILLCVADVFLGEPNGVLQLAAILKRDGHEVKLLALRRQSLVNELKHWNPGVIAYSAMSPEIPLFRKADALVCTWAKDRQVLRVLGGAHATYFPHILAELGLDAICIGEGDRALPELVRRFAGNESLSGIPNILVPGDNPDAIPKELISNLDELPFIDRELYYSVVPHYRMLAMRGFMTGRGCPYECTYCHNHAFKKLFQGCGKIVRRRSVGHVLAEMAEVLSQEPHIRLIRISDDTFAHTINDWLIEFLDRYKSEINLPFYCLMRSNTLTDKMAKLLRQAGCISIGMSVESGNERVRNEILRRGLTDKVVIDSFANARRYGLHTYGNTLLALPDTTFDDDMQSFSFTKRLKMTVPTFGIFSPYPLTRLTAYAIDIGALPANFDFQHYAGRESALQSFSPREKRMQLNLMYLGQLFCGLPDSFLPFLRLLLRLPFGWLYKYIGTIYMVITAGYFIFPNIYPINPLKLIRLLWGSVRFFTAPKN
jgi:anaerobic magnesium-protoporphyrin IX monomethyl ester cyclase